jgi:hypothetical protein
MGREIRVFFLIYFDSFGKDLVFRYLFGLVI